MWEHLNKTIPELNYIENASLCIDDMTISGIKTSDEVRRCVQMKEKNIQAQDFEQAASWRDKEKKEREKLRKK